MPTVKLNISLDAEVAQTLRERAAELRKPASHYLADLIRDDVRRQQDELAAEGYRLLAADTADFAAAAWPLATEVWSEWESERPGAPPRLAEPEENGGAREAQTEPR
jgi:hypothetical protein